MNPAMSITSNQIQDIIAFSLCVKIADGRESGWDGPDYSGKSDEDQIIASVSTPENPADETTW